MYIYELTSQIEVSSRIHWDCCQKTIPSLRVFYDRQDRVFVALTPYEVNLDTSDNIVYNPARYKFIGIYDHASRPEFIAIDLNKLKSEIHETPIRGSLTPYAGIIQRNWQEDDI